MEEGRATLSIEICEADLDPYLIHAKDLVEESSTSSLNIED